MNNLRRVIVTIGLAAATVLGTAVAANAAQPEIHTVTFSGSSGPEVRSPVVRITGRGFGTEPPGTSGHITSCGRYRFNGDVFLDQLYFQAQNNFEAGYSDSDGANCIGIVVLLWNNTHVNFKFGTAYGGFAHWYMQNGDGYAVAIKTKLWGGTVSGLT